jgi:hypothetical protein
MVVPLLWQISYRMQDAISAKIVPGRNAASGRKSGSLARGSDARKDIQGSDAGAYGQEAEKKSENKIQCKIDKE